MFVEGVGYAIPKKQTILLNEKETRTVREYAKSLSNLKGYNPDNCFIGLSGEAALGKFILNETGRQRVANWELYNESGDGGIDIEISGLTVQVKTRSPKNNINRVLRYTGFEFIARNSQVYVFCQVERQEQGFTEVEIHGWIGENELTERGKFRKYLNLWFTEIQPEYLYPISRLITRIKNESYKVSRQQRKVSIHNR